MATLTVNDVSATAGFDAKSSFTAVAAGGDQFLNDGKTFFIIKNGDGSTMVVTVATSGTYSGRAIADDTYTIATTTGETVSPFFPKGVFNDGSGYVQLTYSTDTSVTIAVFKMP